LKISSLALAVFTLLCAGVGRAADGFYNYHTRLGFGMSAPQPGWTRLGKAPQGYPEGDFVFGWERSVDGKRAVIVVTKIGISVEGKTALKETFSPTRIGDVFKDYIASTLGGWDIKPSNVQLGGKAAICVEAEGTGNGVMANPRLGAERTRMQWIGTALSPYEILRVQLAAPSAMFEVLRPEFAQVLASVHFGPKDIPAQAPASTVTDEQIRAAIPASAPVPVAAPTTVSPVNTAPAAKSGTFQSAFVSSKDDLEKFVDENLKVGINCTEITLAYQAPVTEASALAQSSSLFGPVQLQGTDLVTYSVTLTRKMKKVEVLNLITSLPDPGTKPLKYAVSLKVE